MFGQNGGIEWIEFEFDLIIEMYEKMGVGMMDRIETDWLADWL